MELARGELFEFIVNEKFLDEGTARLFIRQILSALEYCHAHLVIHRVRSFTCIYSQL